jgi:hypothetical protein
MSENCRRIDGKAAAHIVGRTAMALTIGWGYLALVLMFDVAGIASWARHAPWATVVIIELFVIVGVMFGTTGARIGYRNVYGV